MTSEPAATTLIAGTVQTHFGGYAPERHDPMEAHQALQHCLAEAEVIEAAGFDGVLVAERHARSECVAPDPIGLLMAVAARTKRVFLGSYVHLPLLHHPVDTAERFAQLDVLSGGRAVAGLGAGFHEDYFRLFGVTTSKRLTALLDHTAVLRAAWAGDDLDETWQDRQLRGPVHPRPVSGTIPIWFGAQFPRAVRAAGLHADGWAVAFPFDDETWRRHHSSYVDAVAESGRARCVVVSRHCWVADSREEAEEVYAPLWLAEQRYYFDRGQLDNADLASPADFTVENARRHVTMGTPEQCAEQLVDLVRTRGVDVVKLACRVPLGPSPARVLDNWRRLGTEVLPAVRAELHGHGAPPARPRDLLVTPVVG